MCLQVSTNHYKTSDLAVNSQKMEKTGGAAFSRPPVHPGICWSLSSGIPLVIRAYVVVTDVDVFQRCVETFMS